MPVGVQRQGDAAVGGLDLGLCGRAGDAKELVEVPIVPVEAAGGHWSHPWALCGRLWGRIRLGCPSDPSWCRRRWSFSFVSSPPSLLFFVIAHAGTRPARGKVRVRSWGRVILIVGRDDLVGGRAHVGDGGLASKSTCSSKC